MHVPSYEPAPPSAAGLQRPRVASTDHSTSHGQLPLQPCLWAKWILPSEVQSGTMQHPNTHHAYDVLRVCRSPKMLMAMSAVGQQRFGPSVLIFVAAPVAPRRRGQADPSPQLWGGLRHQPRVELWWPSRLCSARRAARMSHRV